MNPEDMNPKDMNAVPRSASEFRWQVGGAAWVLTVLYFIGQMVAQAAWKTPYSLIDNRVSDLGSTACGRTVANTLICSPLHAVMNLTFILTGGLILVGLFLTRSIWPRRRLTTWGWLCWVWPGPARCWSGSARRTSMWCFTSSAPSTFQPATWP